MIRCIAIDDEPLALTQISTYIGKIPFLNLLEIFSDAIEAYSYLQENTVDLMFVDINMPELSGMEFVKTLNNPPKVIFITAHREYGVEGFQVDAADYLVKPVSFTKFLNSVEKVNLRYFSERNYIESTQDVTTPKQLESIQLKEKFLFIRADYKIVRLNINDIKYVEGMRGYVRFHTVNAKPVMSLITMKIVEENLPSDKFMRVHRSYFVNLDKIDTVERNRIVFDKDTYIPVSEQYKGKFQEFLDNNFLK